MLKHQSNKKKGRSFGEVITLLVKGNESLSVEDLSVFSALSAENMNTLQKEWSKLSGERKEYLFEGLYLHTHEDTIPDFSEMGHFGLTDVNPKIRRFSLGLLVDCRKSSFLDKVIDMANNDPDEEVRMSAIEILGQFVIDLDLEELPKKEGRKAVKALESLKDDTSSKIRLSVMESLAFMDHPFVSSMIKAALSSDGDESVISGLRAIQHSLNKRWANDVIEHLDHPNTDVQVEAIKAAGMIQSKKAKNPILRILTRFDELESDVLDAAILAASQIGGDQSREIIEELADVFEDDEDMLDLFDEAKDNLDLADFAKKNFTESELRALFNLEEGEEALAESADSVCEDYLQMIRERIVKLPQTEEEDEDELPIQPHHDHDGDEEEELDMSRFRVIEDLSKEDNYFDENGLGTEEEPDEDLL
ncbi:MAG: HEAT repeat domain-containing protein [Flexilinea sp.]